MLMAEQRGCERVCVCGGGGVSVGGGGGDPGGVGGFVLGGGGLFNGTKRLTQKKN